MKWISVNDRLPENEDDVLIYAKNDIHFAFYTSKFWDIHDRYMIHSDEVTHWMTLPEPPKEKEI